MTTLELPDPETRRSETPGTLRRILHPCDLTPGDENAFLHAVRIAVAAKAQLDLVHIRSDADSLVQPNLPCVAEPLRRWGLLPEAASEGSLADLGLTVFKEHSRRDNASAALSGFIAALRPDLTVLATHQRKGWDRLVHGSVAEPLARSASATTLFVPRGIEGFVNPATGKVRLKNVLVPVGSQATAEDAFRLARLLPKLFCAVDTHFTFLHVGNENDLPDPGETLQWAWTTERRTWRGDVVDHIRDSALESEADLIVMTTGGHHNLLDAVLGSITERVVREAKCPVLAARVGADNE